MGILYILNSYSQYDFKFLIMVHVFSIENKTYWFLNEIKLRKMFTYHQTNWYIFDICFIVSHVQVIGFTCYVFTFTMYTGNFHYFWTKLTLLLWYLYTLLQGKWCYNIFHQTISVHQKRLKITLVLGEIIYTNCCSLSSKTRQMLLI